MASQKIESENNLKSVIEVKDATVEFELFINLLWDCHLPASWPFVHKIDSHAAIATYVVTFDTISSPII